MSVSRPLITVAALACGLALITGTTTVGAATRSCREGDRFIQRVRANTMTCKTAVEIALRHARADACFRGEGDLIADRATPCTVRKFRCTPSPAEGGIVVRCKRLNRSMRFFNSGG